MKRLDQDTKIVIVCLVIAILVTFVIVPAHGHFQMLELFGSCGCPFCR